MKLILLALFGLTVSRELTSSCKVSWNGSKAYLSNGMCVCKEATKTYTQADGCTCTQGTGGPPADYAGYQCFCSAGITYSIGNGCGSIACPAQFALKGSDCQRICTLNQNGIQATFRGDYDNFDWSNPYCICPSGTGPYDHSVGCPNN